MPLTTPDRVPAEVTRLLAELSGKIDALFCRGARNGARNGEGAGEPRQFGELVIDTGGRRLEVSGVEVCLTLVEFRLLATLIERRELVVTRKELLRDVWGYSELNRTRTVDTHVKRLRDKLTTANRFIQTVRGEGYRFSERPAARRDRAQRPDAALVRFRSTVQARSGA